MKWNVYSERRKRISSQIDEFNPSSRPQTAAAKSAATTRANSSGASYGRGTKLQRISARKGPSKFADEAEQPLERSPANPFPPATQAPLILKGH